MKDDRRRSVTLNNSTSATDHLSSFVLLAFILALLGL